MEYKKLSGGWDYQVYFGTVPASMYTLFQMVTLENWADGVARHVVSNQPMMALFFLVFLLLTTFGLLNLVVGVIVENTLTAAANNEEKIKKAGGLAGWGRGDGLWQQWERVLQP